MKNPPTLNESSFLKLLNNLPGMFFRSLIDENKKMTFVSEGCLQLTGLTPAELMDQGHPQYSIMIHSEDIPYYTAKRKYNLDHNLPNDLTYRIISRSGEIKWVNETSGYMVNEELKYIEGYIRDVSNHMSSELALRESLAIVQNIYAASLDAVIIIDDKGTIIKWDNKSEALFGWEEHEVLNAKITEIIIPEYCREQYSEFVEHYMAQGRETTNQPIDIRVINKNGTEFDAAISITKSILNGKTHFIGLFRDISGQKKADKKIRESEERYRTLFERNLAGVYRANLDDYIMECNDAYAKMLGFNSSKDVAGKHARDLYDNYSHSNFVEYLTQRNGKVTGYESMIKTREGKDMYTLENASLIYNENGEPAIVEGTVIDITEIKEAQVALTRSRQRYKNLINNMNDGFLVDDISGKVIFANDRFCEIFHIDKNDVEGLELEDYIAPEYRTLLRDRHNKRVAGEKVPDTFEYEGLRKDGQHIWLLVRATAVIEQGKIIGTQSVISDITEKKKREFEFERLAELKRKIVDSSDELFYVTEIKNADTFINPFVYVSDKAKEFYGIDEEQILKQPETWYDAIHPDDIETIKETTQTLFTTGQPVSRVYRIKHFVTGEYIWLYDFVKPILDNTGAIFEFYGSAKNITELKNKETELNKTAIELNNRLNELMQFNYIVSHNLRAPIANITGLCDVIELGDTSFEQTRKMVKDIRNAGGKLDALIKDLNTILTTRSALNTKKTGTSITDLLASTFDTLEKQIQESGTIIETDIAGDANEIFTIKSYLESILYNLISNAIKYKSSAATPQIVVTARKHGDHIEIKVSDNGMGIDLDKHGKYVFGLYKRFNFEVEGKGLGLHMTKTQIETLGGKINVESKLGKGTTFTISLPVNS